MTPVETVGAVLAAVAVILTFLRNGYRLLRSMVRVHAQILGDEETLSLDARLSLMEKRLVPNGNRPIAEGGSLADALHRIEGKVDVLSLDVNDQRGSLAAHVATSDVERAALRHGLSRLEADLLRLLPPSD